MLTRTTPLLMLLALSLCCGEALAQKITKKEWIARKKVEAKALREANRLAHTELTKLQREMELLGRDGEAKDCEIILAKCLEPDKSMHRTTGDSEWPGDEAYETKVLDRFVEVGQKLSEAYAKVAEAIVLNPELKEQYEIISGWLGGFGDVAVRMKHYNRRRAEMKMGPVSCSWAATYGGWMHGRYMRLNRSHPSTAGLGAHNENSSLPGHSSEGAAAAKGIGGSGWFDGWIGSMYHRKPVFDPRLSRISFGGSSGSWWCKKISAGNRATEDLYHWPPADATNITTTFSGEHPNPLPKGVERCGTMIVIQYRTGQPKDMTVHLLDPQGEEITDTLTFGKGRPFVFASREPLGMGRYTVEIRGRGTKHSFSFSTGGSPMMRRWQRPRGASQVAQRPERPTEEKAPEKPVVRSEPVEDDPATAEDEVAEQPTKGDTPSQKAAYAALEGPADKRAGARERFISSWPGQTHAAKLTIYKLFGRAKLLRLGVAVEELDGLAALAGERVGPKPGKVEEAKPRGPEVAKLIEAMLAGDASSDRKQALADLWTHLTIDEKGALLAKHGVARLVSLGLDKAELEELAEFQ